MLLFVSLVVVWGRYRVVFFCRSGAVGPASLSAPLWVVLCPGKKKHRQGSDRLRDVVFFILVEALECWQLN